MVKIDDVQEMIEVLLNKISEDENYSLTWHDLCDIKYKLKEFQEVEQIK